MNEQCQHIVLCRKGRHIVAERTGADTHRFSAQHAYDRVFPAIHVHLNVDFERFIGFGLVPVGTELMAEHSLHHRFRAVHGRTADA